MALIKCSECGKEISTNAKICPHCGNPSTLIEEEKGRLTIHRKSMDLGSALKIKIFRGEELVGELYNDDTIALDIKKDDVLEFKAWSSKPIKYQAKASENHKIDIFFEKGTIGIKEIDGNVTVEEQQSQTSENNEPNIGGLVWGIILAIGGLLLSFSAISRMIG